MKSSASRDGMTTRVSAAFKKWPSFYAMPETKKGGRRVHVAGDPDEQLNYVKALHACCYDGVPIGRDGAAIVCEPSDDEDELVAAPKGRRLKTV